MEKGRAVDVEWNNTSFNNYDVTINIMFFAPNTFRKKIYINARYPAKVNDSIKLAAFSYSPRLNRFIFNDNRHENYDMINNFQQSRRQRCRSFNKVKWGREVGGGGGLQHELE